MSKHRGVTSSWVEKVDDFTAFAVTFWIPLSMTALALFAFSLIHDSLWGRLMGLCAVAPWMTVAAKRTRSKGSGKAFKLNEDDTKLEKFVGALQFDLVLMKKDLAQLKGILDDATGKLAGSFTGLGQHAQGQERVVGALVESTANSGNVGDESPGDIGELAVSTASRGSPGASTRTWGWRCGRCSSRPWCDRSWRVWENASSG